MRWSATRLRWVLLGGVFLLAAVVAGFFGLARYRAGKVWQRILARNGVNLRRETNGITWSQSSKGRTIFTLHASKAVPMGNNRWALHDAVLILYGREHGRDDRIYGSEFSYDESQQILRAQGEVHMDLQAPEPGGKAPPAGARPDLGFGKEDPAALDPAVIHVRTSGLVYMRKMGIAATGKPTEFRFGGITCTSRGAEFDSEHSLVRLLADVKMTGQLQRSPFTLRAAHVELDRSAETADLSSPVLTSADRGARTQHALLHLHKDGTLQAAEANGGVEMRSGTGTVTAPQLNATFAEANHPQSARLFTNVTFSDASAAKPAHGRADTLDLNWAPSGDLTGITANGTVQYASGGEAKVGGAEQREMSAEQLIAAFTPGKKRHSVLKRVRLLGGAELGASSQATSKEAASSKTKITADELVTDFVASASGMPLAQHLSGTGRTQLDQTASDGSRRRSSGDTLEVQFAPDSAPQQTAQHGKAEPMEVTSAVQTGHVQVQTWTVPGASATDKTPELTSGKATKATYSAADSLLTLVGESGDRASLQQAQGELVADRIAMHQGSGDADATGDVAVTSFGATGSQGTHVLASRAQLLHEQNVSHFYGEAGRPAQLWQGGSQIQAALITLDNKSRNLIARPDAPDGRVHAVFAAASERKRGTAARAVESGASAEAGQGSGKGGISRGAATERVPEAERNSVDVTAGRMDYDDAHHEAVFGGGVVLKNVLGEVTSERGLALLRQASATKGPGSQTAARRSGEGTAAAGPDLSGTLDRFVMLGNVQLKQPGRTGSGEQLTYTAATDSFALTGTAAKPPQVTAEQGSVVTGSTLLFQGADSTIVVAGSKGDTKAAGPKRVHTETDLKQ